MSRSKLIMHLALNNQIWAVQHGGTPELNNGQQRGKSEEAEALVTEGLVEMQPVAVQNQTWKVQHGGTSELNNGQQRGKSEEAEALVTEGLLEMQPVVIQESEKAESIFIEQFDLSALPVEVWEPMSSQVTEIFELQQNDAVYIEEVSAVLNEPDGTESAVLGKSLLSGVEMMKPMSTAADNITQQEAETYTGENSDIEREKEQNFDSDDSEKDPDYLPEAEGGETFNSLDAITTGEERESSGSSEKRKVKVPTTLIQKGRKRVRHEENWAKNEAKKLKNLGKSYKSFAKQKRVVPAKEMGPPCGEKCRLQCAKKVDDRQRHQIFQTFWDLGNTERQRNFISSCMTVIKRKYWDEQEYRKRMKNNAFHLLIDNNNVRVCKTYFKSTLAITDRPIRTVLNKQINFEDKRGKHGKRSTVPLGVKESIRNHISKIPTIESHFCYHC